jgi:hypothetical protein
MVRTFFEDRFALLQIVIIKSKGLYEENLPQTL